MSHYDNSRILLNEKTKRLTIERKSRNNGSYEFELNAEGRAEISLETQDESFSLKVRESFP